MAPSAVVEDVSKPETLGPFVVKMDAEVPHKMRMRLHLDPDGTFDGYRISNFEDDSVVAKGGLRVGDVVHEVNGMPLTSVAAAMEAFAALEHEPELLLNVTRRGVPLQLQIHRVL
jgi:type II secretory pathway component PulC